MTLAEHTETAPNLVIRLGLQEIYTEQKTSHKEVLARVDTVEGKLDRIHDIPETVKNHETRLTLLESKLSQHTVIISVVSSVLVATLVAVVNSIIGG